jgi:DNA-binding MarR family transcriptional regulator
MSPSVQKKDQRNELVTLLFATGRIIRQSVVKSAVSSKFSMLQLEVLRYVEEQGEPYMKDIASYFAITPPSATSLVEGLAARGQLRRTTSKDDRRSVRLAITPKGKMTITKVLAEKRKGMKQLVSPLNAQEQHDFIAILNKILTHYDNKK